MTKIRQSFCILHCALCIALAVVSANADTTASATTAPIAVDTREGAIRTVAPRDIGYSPDWCGIPVGGAYAPRWTATEGAYAVIEIVEHADMFNAATSTVTTGDPDEEGDVSFSPAGGAVSLRLVHTVYDGNDAMIGSQLVRDIAFGAASAPGDDTFADTRENSLREAVATSSRAKSPVMLTYDTAWATNGTPDNVAIKAVRLTGEGGSAIGTNTFFAAAAPTDGTTPLKRVSPGWMRLVCRVADGSDATLLEYVTGDFLLKPFATTLFVR